MLIRYKTQTQWGKGCAKMVKMKNWRIRPVKYIITKKLNLRNSFNNQKQCTLRGHKGVKYNTIRKATT